MQGLSNTDSHHRGRHQQHHDPPASAVPRQPASSAILSTHAVACTGQHCFHRRLPRAAAEASQMAAIGPGVAELPVACRGISVRHIFRDGDGLNVAHGLTACMSALRLELPPSSPPVLARPQPQDTVPARGSGFLEACSADLDSLDSPSAGAQPQRGRSGAFAFAPPGSRIGQASTVSLNGGRCHADNSHPCENDDKPRAPSEVHHRVAAEVVLLVLHAAAVGAPWHVHDAGSDSAARHAPADDARGADGARGLRLGMVGRVRGFHRQRSRTAR